MNIMVGSHPLNVSTTEKVDIIFISVSSHENVFQVYTVPVEMSLQNLCRLCILSVVSVTNVYLLPLPKPLQNYLLFKRNYATHW